MQLFARQAKSVRILRDRLKNHAPNHAPEEKHKPEKVQAVPVPAKPAPTPEPATPATELPTIFDVLDSLFAPKPKGEK